MSTKAVGWALEQALPSPAAKLVLVGLAEHADRESWVAWPSRTTCAVYAGCSPRSVTSHFSTLIDSGLVVEVEVDDLTGEMADRFNSLPADKRPRLWLVNPTGAGGKAFHPRVETVSPAAGNGFQSRVEKDARAGGKAGGNGFHQTKTKPLVKTAVVVSNVPDSDTTAALLEQSRTDRGDPSRPSPVKSLKKARRHLGAVS